ncbi:MAG: T9SS type A sorting domain-containing protein [Bacteroidota bacterium]
MLEHQTILSHQLASLSRTQSPNTRPRGLVASALHLRSVFVKSTVAPQLLVIGFWVSSWVVLLNGPVALAQTPESFFPYHVGDTWVYQYLSPPYIAGRIVSMALTRDSIGADGSHNLFFNNQSTPEYRIDTSYSVFWQPQNPLLNYLQYKLAADSCEAWENQTGLSRWAWVARVGWAIVFSRPTVVKVFRYSPGNPCGLGSLEEHWLASGFGLIYRWQEPYDVMYLRGCIIGKDTFGIVTSVDEHYAGDFPKNFELHQNYPNPFNPSTTIRYLLSERTFVRLVVYDILGREVRTLVDGFNEAGIHKVVFDAPDLQTGIYLYRLMAGNSAEVKKMILLR